MQLREHSVTLFPRLYPRPIGAAERNFSRGKAVLSRVIDDERPCDFYFLLSRYLLYTMRRESERNERKRALRRRDLRRRGRAAFAGARRSARPVNDDATRTITRLTCMRNAYRTYDGQ